MKRGSRRVRPNGESSQVRSGKRPGASFQHDAARTFARRRRKIDVLYLVALKLMLFQRYRILCRLLKRFAKPTPALLT